MKKLLNYQKSSFILIEAIISILLLSIIVSSFAKLTYDSKQDEVYKNLLFIHNSFTNQSYDKDFTISNKKLILLINNNHNKEILVKEVLYNNSHIKLKKYEN